MTNRVSSSALVLGSFLVAALISQPPPAAVAFPFPKPPCTTCQCKMISSYVHWFDTQPAPSQVFAYFTVNNAGQFVREYNASGTRCNRIGQPPQPGWTLYTSDCPDAWKDKCVQQQASMIYRIQLPGSAICGGVTPPAGESIYLEGTEPDIPARPDTDPDFPKTECVDVPKN